MGVYEVSTNRFGDAVLTSTDKSTDEVLWPNGRPSGDGSHSDGNNVNWTEDRASRN